MCSATFWLPRSQQLSSVSFAADLHFGVFKCSWRASLKKDFYHRNLFWVDASLWSLRLQPLHTAHVYRRVFFECVSTSAQPKRQALSTSICTDRQQPARLSACVIAPPTDGEGYRLHQTLTVCLHHSVCFLRRIYRTAFTCDYVHTWLADKRGQHWRTYRESVCCYQTAVRRICLVHTLKNKHLFYPPRRI